MSVSSDSKRLKNAEDDTKNLGKLLYSSFLPCINIWDQKVQTSVFYEASLTIIWIKPRAGVTKYSKCMRSHVTRDMRDKKRWKVRMVRLCLPVTLTDVSNLHNPNTHPLPAASSLCDIIPLMTSSYWVSLLATILDRIKWNSKPSSAPNQG